MELWIEPNYIARRKFVQRDDKGRFKKGNKPWNKNLKGVFYGPDHTQFKTGHVPANIKEIGTITMRFHKRTKTNYKYIKLAPGVWKLYHRYIWEKHYGKIPEKHVVMFIDGDTLNCNINNIKCISQTENITRNRNRKKASESMKRLWAEEKRRAAYGLTRYTKLKVK